jgi:protein TonB
MEVNKILSADVLDIIFDGRNKEYGAYDLRKTYNKRMTRAMLFAGAILVLIFLGTVLANQLGKKKAGQEMIVQDVQLEEVKQEQKNEPPPPPPPPKPEPPKVEMAKFTPPKIVKDEEVKEDQEGLKDEGIVAPPASDEGKGVVEAPKKQEEDWDKTFTKVEIESDYPGGASAWMRYLNKSLRYPQEAIDNEIQGTVVVQFIVDKAGNVSDVEAISGPNELRDEAVRVIKKSGQWTPAVQNGRQVKSYKKQPIVFRLETE